MMLLTTSRSPRRVRSPVLMAMRRDCLDCIQHRCSAPLNWVTMNSVIEKGSNVQKTTDAVFEGTVLEAAHQKWDILQASFGSHSQDTPCCSPPVCQSRQKENRVMLRSPLRWEFSPKLQAHCVHHHNTAQLRLPLLAQNHPPSTSWCRHRLQSRESKSPHQTAGVPSSSQPRVSKCAERSRSEEWNKTGRQKVTNLKLIIAFGIRRQYRTNQKLIARPGNSYIDSAGCQHESIP